MKLTPLKLIGLAIFASCLAPMLLGNKSSQKQDLGFTGMADPAAFRDLYHKWEAEYIKYGGDKNFVLPLAWSKGLSSEKTTAEGYVKIDLIDGTVSSQVKGLSLAQGWDVWLIENRSGPDHSVLPEPADHMIMVGTLKPSGKIATLEKDLGPEAFSQFEPDLAVVTRTGMTPEDSRVLVGTTTLFHRLYRSGQHNHFGVLDENLAADAAASEKPGFWKRLFSALSPTAQAHSAGTIDALVPRGIHSFLN